jgi:hypothetical protein
MPAELIKKKISKLRQDYVYWHCTYIQDKSITAHAKAVRAFIQLRIHSPTYAKVLLKMIHKQKKSKDYGVEYLLATLGKGYDL